MATKKKAEKHITEKPKEESVVVKTNSPLVFISHDTRDEKLAEEFSNLLANASAGALKSFRASDKKGSQGIEYGIEWYKAIMEKIDEASEVVCLLTQRSFERPWILYEAGVAKGKLDKKVIGIAFGIPHSVAFTGPFAQFQNNDGSVEAITKLVIDLVRKIPNTDPPQALVEGLVKDFHKKASDIVAQSQSLTETSEQETNDNTVAKLFEEVKVMFENLPSKIENRIDPDYRRKRRKFHPMMFEEFMHMGMEQKDPTLGFLMMVSFYKEDFPWFFEIGLETYRGLKTAKNLAEKRKLVSAFERMFDMLGHPMMREFYGKSDDLFFFMKESRHIMHDFINRFYSDDKIKE